MERKGLPQCYSLIISTFSSRSEEDAIGNQKDELCEELLPKIQRQHEANCVRGQGERLINVCPVHGAGGRNATL